MPNFEYSETMGAGLCTGCSLKPLNGSDSNIFWPVEGSTEFLAACFHQKGGQSCNPANELLKCSGALFHHFMWKNCSKGGILTHHLEVSHDVTNPWAISHAWPHPNEALKKRQAAEPWVMCPPTLQQLWREWDLRKDAKVILHSNSSSTVLTFMSFCNCPVPFLKTSSGCKVCFIGFCASVKFKYQSGMDVLYKNVAKFRDGNNIQ